MKKTIVYIVAAIVAIALAFSLFVMFRNQTQQQPPAIPDEDSSEEAVQVETTEVIVAKQRIPAGTEITETQVYTMSIPRSEQPVSAVESIKRVVGTTANRNIDKDTIIIANMVDEPNLFVSDTKGLSYKIPEGFVGMAIPAAELDGVAGYLTPGDVVNILADAKSVKAAMTGTPYIEGDVMPTSQAYLAKNVTILAVGDKEYDKLMAAGIKGERNAESGSGVGLSNESNEQGGDKTTYNCVIIALDDVTAQIVAEVMKTSSLTLALKHRSYGLQEVTTPELVPVAQQFSYLTEDEIRN